MLRFPNPTNNEWLNKYNHFIDEVEQGNIHFEENWMNLEEKDFSNKEEYRLARVKAGKTGIHHIIPKKIDPSIQDLEENHIHVPFVEHMNMHYWLWKYDKQYAKHLWFGCVYGRKYGIWDLPGGDIEYEQLKRDLRS